MYFFRRYCDTMALTYQAERMPEQIRLKVGGVTPQQMAVYEEFARNIPGFLPLSERDTAMFIPKPTLPQEPQPLPTTPFPGAPIAVASDDISTVYEKLAVEIEQFLQLTGAQNTFASLNANMHVLHECLIHARRNSRDIVSALNLLQKVCHILYN